MLALLLAAGMTAPADPPGADVGWPFEWRHAAAEPSELDICLERQRETVDAALALAHACGIQVEITGQQTETRREWAQPDGTIRAQVYVGPEWVQNASGSWDRVDLTLQVQPDGSVAPRVHARGLQLSGGAPAGTDQLAVVGSGSQRLSMGWNGRLPAPKLAENTATYREVRPGVDLVVQALNTGFEYHLVVKSPQAARQLDRVAVPWHSGTLEPFSTPDGGVALRASDGSVPAFVPTAAMWDSEISPVSGEPANRVEMDMAVDTDLATGEAELVIEPDRAFLDDPDTQYPVIVDPTVERSPGFDAFVQTGITSSQSGSTELKLGTYNGGSTKARSFLSFHNMAFLYGATVHGAYLYLFNTWSYSCRHASWQAWRTSYVNSTVRWNNQPSWQKKNGETSQTWGYDACDPDNYVYISVKEAFQNRADAGSSTTVNIGVRAKSETNSDGWKRFRSANASSKRPFVELSYTANRSPKTPTAVKVSDHCAGSCSSGTVVRNTRVPLQAKLTDPDGHQVRGFFQVRKGTSIVYESSQEVSSGGVATRNPTLSNGSSYKFRVRGRDRYGKYGSWSSYFPFSIDASGPSKPTGVGVDSACAGSCSSPAVLRDRRPVFAATPQHKFGDRTDLVFQVYDEAKSSVVASGTVANAAKGVKATWRPPSNLPQEATLHLRVRSTNDDYGRNGSYSAWYTFTVDTQAPAMPTISSPLYLHKDTGTWNGGVGQPGSFTFGPGGADDVVTYQWRFGGGTVSEASVSPGATHTVSVVPPGDLEQQLEVRSVDRAGNISAWRAYPFYVRPQPVDAGYWKFDESTGTSAASAVGETAYDGQLHGGAGWAASGINLADPAASGNAVQLDGASGYVEMPRVLATDHTAGFSVSAWVNPDDLSAERTVAVQHGGETYAYWLSYSATTDQWCFRVSHADADAAARTSVCSDLPPQTGVWTHLVGVYDKPAGKIRLWVNGGPNSGLPAAGDMVEASAPALWASNGSFTVGRRVTGAAMWWSGRIDEVRAHQRVLAEFEVVHVYRSCLLAACPAVPKPDDLMLVGGWDFEDTGTVASDSSGFGNHGTLSGAPGAQWTAFGHGQSRGVALDGASGWIETVESPLLTEQSFSVSAWVNLGSFTGDQQVVLQTQGIGGSAVKLYHHPDQGWCFGISSYDGVNTTWRAVCASTPAQLGVWTHLVGVYDAAAGAVRLYLNGQLDGDRVGVAGQPATAGLRIGGRPADWHLDGTIDTVRAYQGAASSTQVAGWYDQQAQPPQPVPPVLAGDWRLDDGAGTVAFDYTWLGNDGFLSGGASWPAPADAYAGQYGVSFDGASGQVESSWAPVATDDSFTVSAWVSLETRDIYRTAVSGNGAQMAAFRLYYNADQDRYCFAMFHKDQPGSPVTRACDASPPEVGAWKHLVGVFDKAAQQVRLYVDGELMEAATYTGLDPWQATSPLVVGRTVHTPLDGATVETDWWAGEVALVQAYQGAMAGAGVAQLHGAQLNPSPTAVIDTPSGAELWQVGEQLAFTGHGTDSVGTMPEESLSWELRLVDCSTGTCESEILQEWSGVASGSFTAPDAGYPAHLELELTADNGSGMVDSAVVELDPATVELTLATAPAGLELMAGEETVIAPDTRTAIVGASLGVAAPTPQELDTTSYVFDGWTDGGAQTHLVTVPAADTTLTADYLAASQLAPTAVIDAPNSSLSWRTDDLVEFSGHATDAGGVLPDSALHWQLWLVTCPDTCQAEPLADWSGVPSGSFVAPDAEYPAHLELELTADNGSGLTDTALVRLDPATVDLTFDTVPPGLQLAVGEETQVAPITRTAIQGASVAVAAPTPQRLGATSYQFGSWSDGGAQTHLVFAPETATSYTASFVAEVPGTSCGTDGYGHACTEGPRPFLPATEPLALTGDDEVAELALPFPVWLYGELYDRAWVDTNGLVTFLEPETSADSPATIPSEYVWGTANAAVYPFWNNWTVDQDAGVLTGLVGSAPERRFVVEWRNVAAWSDGAVRVSFQVVFHESGEIAFAWDGIDADPQEQGAQAVVGIENLTGTEALAYSQLTASLGSGQGVLFTPPATGTVAGTVVEAATGAPLAETPVRLNPGGWETFTDESGSYEFLDVPVGSHGVVAGRADGVCAGTAATAVVAVASGGAATADLSVGSGTDAFGNTCTELPQQEFLPTTDVLTTEGYYGTEQVALPFPVTFYGQVYDTAWVAVDGAMTFLAGQGDLDNISPIPSPPDWGKANAAIYPFWNDWIVSHGGSIRTGTVGTAPERKFVVEWRDVWSGDWYQQVSFQVVLHETGEITMAYDIDPSLVERGLAGVVGIENAAGTDALVYSQFAPALADGAGLRFDPPSQLPGAGYTMSSGARPFLPAGDVLDLSGDDVYTAVTLPFPVALYGQSYTTVWVDSNGVVSMVEPDGSSWNTSAIPSPAGPNTPSAAVYPLWDDLVVDGQSSVLTGLVGSAPDRQFVIEWRDVAFYDDQTARVSFQVILGEDGEIAIAWDGIDGTELEQGSGAVVGIENAEGTQALVYSQFQPGLASGQGVWFAPDDPPATTGGLAGTVTCAGDPVGGAQVAAAGSSTATAADGSWQLNDLPLGHTTLIATAASGGCAGSTPQTLPVVGGTVTTVDTALAESSFGRSMTTGPRPVLAQRPRRVVQPTW